MCKYARKVLITHNEKKEDIMKYYNVLDVQEITGAEVNKAYEIIRNLNKKYKKKYPDCEILQGKVLKTFFNEAMGIDVEEKKKNLDKKMTDI